MKHKWVPALALFALALSGCQLTLTRGPAANSTRAWFDAPLPGTVTMPPNPCEIVAHGGSPSGVALFELSINGQAMSIPSPDTTSSLVTLTRACGFSEPGEYQLRLRIKDNAGIWSGFAETNVTIGAALTSTAAAVPPARPTPTSTPTDTPTPAPVVQGEVSVQSVSTDLVYVGDNSCGPVQVSIVAHATAPKGIAVVVLFYRFEPGSPSGFQNLAMGPAGNDLYAANLNPTSLLGGGLAADQATLQYQIVVQQKDGDTSIRTPVMADIALQPCGNVQVVDCSNYTTKKTCENHGCNWELQPGIVPVYECKGP
jgi:hypothetical protein